MKNKLLLFVSSYIPLYLLLIGKNILERITEKGRFINISERIKTAKLFDEVNDYAIMVMIILSVISFFYLKSKIKSTVGRKKYKVITIVNETSNYYFNYISIYLLSCLGLSLNNIVDCFVFLFLMVIVGYIYISNNMVYMNPVLNFMGYKIYACTLESVNTSDEDFDTVLVAPSTINIHIGDRIRGTGKQDFVCANEKIEE